MIWQNQTHHNTYIIEFYMFISLVNVCLTTIVSMCDRAENLISLN